MTLSSALTKSSQILVHFFFVEWTKLETLNRLSEPTIYEQYKKCVMTETSEVWRWEIWYFVWWSERRVEWSVMTWWSRRGTWIVEKSSGSRELQGWQETSQVCWQSFDRLSLGFKNDPYSDRLTQSPFKLQFPVYFSLSHSHKNHYPN
jgi:hypothetical protein